MRGIMGVVAATWRRAGKTTPAPGSDKYPGRIDLHLALGSDFYLRLGDTFRRKGDLTHAIDALRQAMAVNLQNVNAETLWRCRGIQPVERKTRARGTKRR